MSNEPEYTDDIEAYPRQPQEGRPDPSRRRQAFKMVLTAVGILAACGLVVGTGFGILYGLNPMGDEWVCSDGEAPADFAEGGSDCYAEGSTLPPGVTWDPFGNRPMPYNCDKDGWVPIERPVNRRGVSDIEQDCVREGTELPGQWHIVDDD